MFFFYVCAASLLSVDAVKNSESEYVRKEDFEKLSADFANVVRFLKGEIAALKEAYQQHKPYEDAPELDNAEPVVSNFMNDSNIEGRVAALEEQMTIVNDDIAELDEQVENAEAQIVLIKSDQVLQDQRLLDLEDNTDALESNVHSLEDAVTNLETQDSLFNASINHLEEEVNDIKARLSRLEFDGTFAFRAILGEYTSVPLDTDVIFPDITVNLGNGYNGTTGAFTVPSGGSGLYYFYIHFRHYLGESAGFDIRLNGDGICAAYGDGTSGGDAAASSCGTTVVLNEGDVLNVYYSYGTDDTPVHSSSFPFNGFTGFRIAPM